ncbi:VOC family protein [Ilumatobacter sp.]|uniref:VOC family protein n=1 Tax=Ilumatobacter sp. TaxID=1967498 RepID=UPI003C5E40E0
MFDLGVHHVSLNVTDAAEARRFYVDVLGLTERPDRPDFTFDGSWLQAGDQQIHLLEVDDFVPPVGQHFALRIGDIEAARAHLARHGVEVSEAKRVDDICLQAFFSDPTGNLIELNQPL